MSAPRVGFLKRSSNIETALVHGWEPSTRNVRCLLQTKITNMPTNQPQDPGEILLRIENVVDQLVEAWEADPEPDLRAFLAEIEPEHHEALIPRLLDVDLDRRQCGDHNHTQAHYLEVFPDHSQVIREVFQSRIEEDLPPTAEHPPFPDQDSLDPERRFPDGTVIANRYRIERFLGRGGMGEVYEAEDQTLGQRVALKFLLEEVARRPRYLGTLYNEVRTARSIAHPNVCGVYHVEQWEDENGTFVPFVEMELVKGTELTPYVKNHQPSTERRLEIARQLCAGLHAAHNRGVIHRDLKPANVMIDESGKVRIMDFGLAVGGKGQGISGAVGTLGYAPPEQLVEGGKVTPRSDVYSLGLVLYELFTEQRAFDSRSPSDLQRRQKHKDLTLPSTHVPDLDSKIEAAILRCLEPLPENRPASAIHVQQLLGLPLSEPLPPEADTQAASSIPRWQAVTCLVTVFVALLILVLLQSKVWILERVPMSKTPDVLTNRAQNFLTKLGHAPDKTPVVDRASGFVYEDSYLFHVLKNHSAKKDRFSYLSKSQPATIQFWYRQSPELLTPKEWKTPEERWRLIYPDDPPMLVPGMITLKLNPQGQMIELQTVPHPKWSGSLNSEKWWQQLESLTGLELNEQLEDPGAELSVAVPRDDFKVWRTKARDSGVELQVEAAIYRGRVTYYKAFPIEVQHGISKPSGLIRTLAFWIVLMGLTILAVRNLRHGRADVRGAKRVMMFLFATWLFTFILQANHRADPVHEHRLLLRDLGFFMRQALYFLIAYLAVESFARRYWPDSLTTWLHVLEGRFREPLVGRDLLVGTALGVSVVAIRPLIVVLYNQSGLFPEALPVGTVHLHTLMGTGSLIGAVGNDLYQTTLHTWILLAFYLLLRILFQRKWVAGVVFFLTWTVAVMGAVFPHPDLYGRVPISWIHTGLIVAALQFAVTRFGLVAAIVTYLVVWFLFGIPITADLNRWYRGGGFLILALIAGMAIYGFSLIRTNPTPEARTVTGSSRWSL